MAGAVFPFSFLFLFLNRSLPLRHPLCAGRRGRNLRPWSCAGKTIDRMVIFQRAGDLPFVLYGGDGQCFGSQFFRYMMDVLFILLRVVGTGAIDQQTAGFQRVPDVVDDAAPRVRHRARRSRCSIRLYCRYLCETYLRRNRARRRRSRQRNA